MTGLGGCLGLQDRFQALELGVNWETQWELPQVGEVAGICHVVPLFPSTSSQGTPRGCPDAARLHQTVSLPQRPVRRFPSHPIPSRPLPPGWSAGRRHPRTCCRGSLASPGASALTHHIVTAIARNMPLLGQARHLPNGCAQRFVAVSAKTRARFPCEEPSAVQKVPRPSLHQDDKLPGTVYVSLLTLQDDEFSLETSSLA